MRRHLARRHLFNERDFSCVNLKLLEFVGAGQCCRGGEEKKREGMVCHGVLTKRARLIFPASDVQFGSLLFGGLFAMLSP